MRNVPRWIGHQGAASSVGCRDNKWLFQSKPFFKSGGRAEKKQQDSHHQKRTTLSFWNMQMVQSLVGFIVARRHWLKGPMFKNNTLRVVTQICLGKITPQKDQILRIVGARENPISFPFQSHSDANSIAYWHRFFSDKEKHTRKGECRESSDVYCVALCVAARKASIKSKLS